MNHLFRIAENSVSRLQLLSPKLSQARLSLPTAQFAWGLLSVSCLLSAIGRPAIAANELEFSSGSYSTTVTGPSLTAGPANLLENTTGTTFVPFTPNISVNVSISNPQYPNGLQLGTTTGTTGSPILNRLNFYGGGTDTLFTSNPNGPAGTGVSVVNNYAFEFFAFVDPLISQPKNARYYYGDITVTFNRPVSDPVLHMTGMGGNSTQSVTDAFGNIISSVSHGHSSEFELITPGITPSKLSGSNFLTVTGNQIKNNAATITASCSTGAACGSVKFPGTNITSLTFKVYVRGDAGTAEWSGGDVFLFGATSIAKPVTISGTVLNDQNGLTDNLINGTGTNADGLFANLVDTSGKVVASMPVAANGTYSFLAIGAGQYTVSLSTTAGVQGTTAPPANLPANWTNTGEGTAAAGDGTVNGSTAITVASTNLSGVNFGILAQSSSIVLDYGDAPDTATGTGIGNYQTLASDGGPRHEIIPGLSIGATVDGDSGSLQNAAANADDTDATPDDEEGIASFPALTTTSGQTYSIPVNITHTAGGNAYLIGYIDFNKDGDFNDTGEQSAPVTVTTSGTQNVSFTTPAGMTAGNTYARFRISKTLAEVQSSIGAATSGEVEDYPVPIVSSFVNGTCQADGLVWVSGSSGQISHYRVSNQTFTTVSNGMGNVWGDIAWASDNKLYGATFAASPSLYEINPTTGASTLVASLSAVMRYPNAMSGLPDASLLIGAASNTKVYRFDLTMPSNPPTIWHDFGAGDPSGDFILFNNKIYVAWRNGGAESLYEVTIDANYNYISHRDLGALPASSWGLALVLNKLYIASNTNLYRINGIPTDPIATIPVTAVTQTIPYSLYGATGIEEPFGGCSPMLPNLLLVKRITAINSSTNSINGDNLSGYTDSVTNPYDDNIITIPTQSTPADPARDTTQWPTPSSFLIGGINGGNVKPGDEMEYTIYFLSAGDAEAKNVMFCDRVPSNVTFIPTAFNSATPATGGLAGDRGILSLLNGTTTAYSNVADGDAARYFAPGEDPQSIFPNLNCGGPNTNGAVVVNLGDLPNATTPANPIGSYGFVRFRGRVK
jgi:uncharacterized repeat protein (TIGR01451 family)